MRSLRNIPALLLLVILSHSCDTIDVVKRIHSEDVEIVQFYNDDKKVHFIPMHHVGKPLFYERVEELVKHFKSEGYIVYYESAKVIGVKDSLQLDIINRKFRKMMGLHVDSSGYAVLLHEKGLLRSLVDQPPYAELGLDKKDKHVDLPKNKLVDEYENRFGPVVLTREDSTIALDDDYPLHLSLPQKQLLHIIVDYRNQHLAHYIQQSPDEKIVVVYGALHMKGTFEELKKMDGRWKMQKSAK